MQGSNLSPNEVWGKHLFEYVEETEPMIIVPMYEHSLSVEEVMDYVKNTGIMFCDPNTDRIRMYTQTDLRVFTGEDI